MGSQLTIYSIGIVAKDIVEDEVAVDIFPIELVQDRTGKISDVDTIGTTTKDQSGNIISANVNKSAVITAKWLAINQANRVTPPNVCKGETVLIYRYEGSDSFYWSALISEPDIRKKEKVTYFFSNKDTVVGEDWVDKSYTVTVDTINKLVRLRTNDNDSEKAKYDITLDTKEGIFSISDGHDNSAVLHTPDKKLSYIIKDLIETENKRTMLNTKKFGVSNGSDELIALLSELIAAIIAEQHIGNLGINTVLTAASISKFEDIKSRLEEFIDK